MTNTLFQRVYGAALDYGTSHQMSGFSDMVSLDTAAFVSGGMGMLLSISTYFPQIWKAYRTKSTNDVSWGMIGISVTNAMAWTVYGVARADPIITITNAIAFASASTFAAMKRRYDSTISE